MRQYSSTLTLRLIQICLSLALLGASLFSAAQTTPTPIHSLPGRPLWSDLNEAQQHALSPLSEQWHTMNEPHKRKWLALSQNFSQLSPEEQNTLQSRMKEWAALSPQKRTAARLNFADAKNLSQGEKKAKWEAYQALPAETKQKLAAQQPHPPLGAAPAVKPLTTNKLVPPPPATASKPLPRINTTQLAPVTLLPAPGAPAASAPASAILGESAELPSQ